MSIKGLEAQRNYPLNKVKRNLMGFLVYANKLEL